jgi:hypothetical protein
LDDIRDRERLSATWDSKKDLIFFATTKPFDQLLDRSGLVSFRRVLRAQSKHIDVYQ